MNNLIEQDHRFIKRLVKPGLGFFSFESAWRTLQGYEVMNMIRKGQVHGVGKGDIKDQSPSSPACLEWRPNAAFLIGANIKVKLKASKYDSTSQILFFSPNEERSTMGPRRILSHWKSSTFARMFLCPILRSAPNSLDNVIFAMMPNVMCTSVHMEQICTMFLLLAPLIISSMRNGSLVDMLA